MNQYWIFSCDREDCDPATKYEFLRFSSKSTALEFVNDNPNREFTIVEGKEMKLKPVTKITKWEFEK